MLTLRAAILRPRTVCLLLAVAATAGCGFGLDAEARVERGQQAFDAGRYQAAIIDARNVLIEEPGNIAARILLARALIEVADGVTAEKEIRRAAELGATADDTLEYLGRALLVQGEFAAAADELDPDAVASPDARIAVLRVLGHALVGTGRAGEARDAYGQVLEVLDDDVESQLGIVNSYAVEGNFVQARATMNEILTAHDDDVSAWLNSASLSMRSRNAARAATDYARALELLAGRPDLLREMRALSGYAEALLLEQRRDEARSALERMQAIAPEDARTRMIAARLAALDRDWITAQTQLQEVLRLAPEYRPAQMLLGVVYKETGQLGQAEMYLSAVVASAPGNENARRLLAETRLALNKSAAAREAIESVIAGPNADARALSIAAAANLDLGEYRDAADLLERGLAADPDNGALRIELALAYFRAGDRERVRELLLDMPDDVGEHSAFSRDLLLAMVTLAEGGRESGTAVGELLDRWPQQPDAYVLAGTVDMANSDLAAARASFTKSMELAPGDAQPLRLLAQLDEIEGDGIAARSRYLRILEIDPADAVAMLALSRLALQENDDDASLEWLEKARSADPGAIAPRELLGARYLANRDFTAASAVAQEGITLDPDNAAFHNMLGFARLATEDLRGALTAFRQATMLAPGEAAYALNLARAQDKSGSPEAALATLEESRSRTLQHVASGVLLTWLHLRNGEQAKALDIADELLDRHPDDASAHALKAEVLLRQGDLAAASAAYERASALQVEPRFAVRASQIRRRAGLPQALEPMTTYLEARPFDTTVRLLLAQLLQQEGDAAAALEQYERILSYDAGNLVAGNNLAWAYFRNGDPRAAAVARRSYDAHPDNGAVMDTLGWIMVNQGELQGGIGLLRDAVRLNSGSREARYHLAAALYRSGEREESRRLLEEVLSSAQDFAGREDAEELLATF